MHDGNIVDLALQCLGKADQLLDHVRVAGAGFATIDRQSIYLFAGVGQVLDSRK
ncbi:hypothetical protein D3C78_1665270 [compost metagenome]